MSCVSDHRCHRCSNQQHLRVQPAGRGPWSLHQPNGLHLCRVPAGRGGGGTERCPTGLQPYWHEQTLWLAAFWNRAVMWLARGNDESVCWLFRRAPSDWSAGCLSLYSRPECLHGWLCQLCQYFWEETCRDASHSRWDDDVWTICFKKHSKMRLIWFNLFNKSVSLWRGSTKRIKEKSTISPSWRIWSIAREGNRSATNQDVAFIQMVTYKKKSLGWLFCFNCICLSVENWSLGPWFWSRHLRTIVGCHSNWCSQIPHCLQREPDQH